ncbi:hypothetical protein FHS43_000579 [Streptosporangium becharense]|uniref:Uncharacterized protein n=1 Tax=Streptosporangium becharense TaxID=1816182 RepID=A0A7W9IPF6_9ACTN|nr:hypothetical protein [Streptosporangium becharense]MBB2909333.1 hypothetical protein [Streptosporangium becharense]MBB5823764.1 hypothetical protein [Streptosporangium becharense]
MSYPPPGQPQQPYGQHPQPYGHAQPPQPYGQAQPMPYGQPSQPYPTGGYPPPVAMPQQPMQVQQVGHSVTKPAWTCGEMALMFCTMGLAYPIIWMRRRARTTVTRHR